MTFIYLKATDKSNTYGPEKVKVKHQQYDHCYMFTRYEHNLGDESIQTSIKIYKDYNSGRGNFATLTPGSLFSSAILEKVHVYYNKHDQKLRNPLVLVLFFKNISTESKNKYYKRSSFDIDIKKKQTKDIDKLDKYINDKDVLKSLIEENATAGLILTYLIDNTTKGYYNIGNIQLTEQTSSPSNGFITYIHILTSSDRKIKACVLYNQQVLLWRNSRDDPPKMVEITEIQNVNICSVTVYYSKNVKEPLMVEFVIDKGSKKETSYYFHKKHENSLYWQILDSGSSSEIMGRRVSDGEIPNKLIDSDNKLLIRSLNKIESYLFNTLIILVDKQTEYSESDVVRALKLVEIDRYDYRLINHFHDIKVNEVSSKICNTMTSKGYKVHEHDLEDVFRSFRKDEKIRLILIKTETKFLVENNLLTINLENDIGYYSSQSRVISVSLTNNPTLRYKWYKHSCEQEITGRTFQLHFNGYYLTVEGDLSEPEVNIRFVLVYFSYDYPDKFILVAFPSQNFDKIRYMTYSDFEKSILSGNIIKLSKLEKMDAITKKELLRGGWSYKIDEPLLKKLQDEYANLKSDITDLVDTLYYEPGQYKLYIYSYGDNLQPLMICYNNKAYKRYYLGKNMSKWKLVKEITKCICNDKDENFEKTLSDMTIRQGLVSKDSVEKVESEDLITLDISKTGLLTYDSNRVTVTNNTYESCNLFVYYTHSNKKGLSFKISTLKYTSLKNIKLNEDITVKSVDVYFNRFIESKPLILLLKTESGQDKYYKDLIQTQNTYKITQNIEITSNNLCDKLIEESERISSIFIYHIDKTSFNTQNNKYGHDNSISISKEEKTKFNFIICTHRPTNGKSRKGFILYKNNFIDCKSENSIKTTDTIQNKSYIEVKVYFLERDKNFPLVVELRETKKSTYYSQKENETKLYWEKVSVDLDAEDKIKNKLDEIYYFLNNSAIIEIDKGGGTKNNEDTNYSVKIIENKVDSQGLYEKTSYTDGKLVISKTVSVSFLSTIPDNNKAETKYKIFSHQISISNSLSSPGVSESVISGVRLFLQVSKNDPAELEFYDNENNAKQSKNRLFLHYPPQNNVNKIYIYFFYEDPRPISLCYNSQMYKRFSNTNTKWVCIKKMKCSEHNDLYNTVKSIYETMKKKLVFVKEGNPQNFSESEAKQIGTFKSYSYTPNVSNQVGPYKLSKNKLIESLTNKTIINNLLDELDNKPFDTINVYYKENKNKPFLFEFINDSDKTHYQRLDVNSKYWVNEKVEYSETNLNEKLNNIKKNSDSTIVYEIDKTSDSYNDYVTLKSQPNQPIRHFTKNIHSVKGNYNGKTSCVLYNEEKLIEKKTDNFEAIKELQNQIFSTITVYFGKKKPDVPLIVEFTGSYNSKSYYKHKLQDSTSFWESISISSGKNNKDLIEKLRETELDFVKSIVVLLDKHSNYNDSEIQKPIKKLKPHREINTIQIGSNSIQVRNKTTDQGKCISNYFFNVYEHDLSSYIGSDDNYGFRFFIYSSDDSDRYCEIKLYNEDVFDTLYYEKNGKNGKDKIYVYFYDRDTRPLLFCYNGSAYKPKSLLDYETKWIRDTKINRCDCNQLNDNSNLINSLSEVVKFLNVVKLEEKPTNMTETEPNRPGKHNENQLYDVQTYNNKKFQVKVTYENKTCYRLYKHVPYGTTGQSDGYRLGEIKYNSSDSLNYTNNLPLLSVNLYYNVYDNNHEHPLLVSLEFKSNGNEYHKLTSKNSKQWDKIDSNIEPNEIENKAYQIWKDLQIGYNKNNHLFNPEKCNEDDFDWLTIGASSGGAVAGVGGIVGIGVLVYKKLIVVAVSTATKTVAHLS